MNFNTCVCSEDYRRLGLSHPIPSHPNYSLVFYFTVLGPPSVIYSPPQLALGPADYLRPRSITCRAHPPLPGALSGAAVRPVPTQRRAGRTLGFTAHNCVPNTTIWHFATRAQIKDPEKVTNKMYGCNTDISNHFFRIFNLRPSTNKLS